MCVVYAHAAEDGESFHEVLIVFREGQVVELVNKLNDANYLAGGIFNGHAEDGLVLEAGAIVDALVEARIFVCVGDVHSL